MRRFSHRPLDGVHTRMEFHSEFEALRAVRELFDKEIIAWAESLFMEWLAADFTYISIADGITRTRPAWMLVTHVFNHQTHHRGQLTTLPSQFGVDVGVTDLPAMQAKI